MGDAGIAKEKGGQEGNGEAGREKLELESLRLDKTFKIIRSNHHLMSPSPPPNMSVSATSKHLLNISRNGDHTFPWAASAFS